MMIVDQFKEKIRGNSGFHTQIWGCSVDVPFDSESNELIVPKHMANSDQPPPEENELVRMRLLLKVFQCDMP
jgi:hypothetical protein